MVTELLDVVGRVVVAGAFALAAVLKLADLAEVRATLYLSRLTRPWVPQLSLALPATELVLAAALATTRGAWAAAVLSAALLVAFTLFLALDPVAGEGCACFGRRSRSSRRRGIARDVLLVAALLPAVVTGPGAARPGVPERFEAAFCVVALGAIAVGSAGAVRRDRARRARPAASAPSAPSGAAAPSGASAPSGSAGRSGRRRAGVPPQPPRVVRREAVPFDLPAVGAGRVRLADLLPARPVLLFAEVGCELCELLLPEVAARPDVVVLAAGPAADVAALAVRHGLPPGRVALDEDGAVADAYRLPATPGACRLTADGVLVDAAGNPTERLSVGVDAVRALLAAPGPS